jgi:hypothetical protein
MNCSDATELLDRLIFENAPVGSDLRQHFDTCSSCSQIYRNALQAQKVLNLARRMEPMLPAPDEFTERIMSAIVQRPPKTARVLPFLQHLLAAASIAIFLLLGYEQYHVVKKISSLEVQFSQIKPDMNYSNPLQLASGIYLNHTGISVPGMERHLSRKKGINPISFSYIQKRFNQQNLK